MNIMKLFLKKLWILLHVISMILMAEKNWFFIIKEINQIIGFFQNHNFIKNYLWTVFWLF